MKYFIRDSRTEECTQVTEQEMQQALGKQFLERVQRVGCVSCGSTIYECYQNYYYEFDSSVNLHGMQQPDVEAK